MHNPFFSMVAPNLNEKEQLSAFLNSLVNQSFKDFEVVVVDGGSSDGSLSILRGYKDRLNLTVVMDKKPNIGYIRNVGAEHAKGIVLFHTSSDVVFPRNLLQNLYTKFAQTNVSCVSGRTKPTNNDTLCHLAYGCFDLLRYAFTKLPFKLRKYRPSGNFLAIRQSLFKLVGGYPAVRINEDGLLGYKLDEVNVHVCFDLSLSVFHHAKRFKEKGSLRTIMFYAYVLGNMFPWLRKALGNKEQTNGLVFMERTDLPLHYQKRKA